MKHLSNEEATEQFINWLYNPLIVSTLPMADAVGMLMDPNNPWPTESLDRTAFRAAELLYTGLIRNSWNHIEKAAAEMLTLLVKLAEYSEESLISDGFPLYEIIGLTRLLDITVDNHYGKY